MRFEIDREGVGEYVLEDGTHVRVRTVLIDVKRREGQYTEHGAPIYDFNMQQYVHVEPAQDLMRSVLPETQTRN